MALDGVVAPMISSTAAPAAVAADVVLTKDREGGGSGGGVALNMVIRQHPFSVTLDAWALLVGSMLLVAGMHWMQRCFLEGLVVGVPLVLLVRNDYVNFLLLGPGGTPATFAGYVRLTWYRLFALRDVFRPPTPPPDRSALSPPAGILSALPYRPGPRPLVAGLAPQRQLNQRADPSCYAALTRAMERLTRARPDALCTATSCIEKHGFGLFARHPVNVWGQGEICHIHEAEKSMHMSLHPDDIKEVLEKGWGQRHPLAFTGWGPIKAPLPSTFVMIYAPRGMFVWTFLPFSVISSSAGVDNARLPGEGREATTVGEGQDRI